MKKELVHVLGSLALAMTLSSCSNGDQLNFSGVDPALTVPPTKVMVLATSHLSNHQDDLTLEHIEPLMERLTIYAPDIITIEGSSGKACNRARTYPLEHEGYTCFDGSPFREESGLSIPEGSFQAQNALLDWPEKPTAAQRRTLAAAFIAGDELYSALVQWYHLKRADRVAGDGLGPKSVDMLNLRSQDMNESNSIAARLAARQGLERVFYADDYGSYIFAEGERDAYGARLQEIWSSENDNCSAHFNATEGNVTGDDILGAYRYLNSKNWQRTQMSCDWKRTMNDAQPEQFGRRYTLGWQARNLHMVSLIMVAATNKPGGRVLSIVGASHKPYFEVYLDQMHDIEIVNTDTILDD